MIDEMVQHAVDDLPNECCGVITGDGDGGAQKLYRTRNAEASPFRYSIDPRDLLRIEREMDEGDQSVLVIYHSHVASDAYPSPTDVRLSQWQGSRPAGRALSRRLLRPRLPQGHRASRRPRLPDHWRRDIRRRTDGCLVLTKPSHPGAERRGISWRLSPSTQSGVRRGRSFILPGRIQDGSGTASLLWS